MDVRRFRKYLEFAKSKINKYLELFLIRKTKIWLKKIANFGTVYSTFRTSRSFATYIRLLTLINSNAFTSQFLFPILVPRKSSRSTFELSSIFKFETLAILKFLYSQFKASKKIFKNVKKTLEKFTSIPKNWWINLKPKSMVTWLFINQFFVINSSITFRNYNYAK